MKFKPVKLRDLPNGALFRLRADEKFREYRKEGNPYTKGVVSAYHTDVEFPCWMPLNETRTVYVEDKP